MNVQDLQTMLDYHYWARDRMLEAAAALTSEQYEKDLGSSFRSVRETATHIYAAEWAWYQRWHGESPTTLLTADRFADLAVLTTAWTEHERKMRAFVDGLDDEGVARVIAFTLLSGQAGRRPSGRWSSTSSTTRAITAGRLRRCCGSSARSRQNRWT
jgi:uncharacterized damage-inducible protein DinB